MEPRLGPLLAEYTASAASVGMAVYLGYTYHKLNKKAKEQQAQARERSQK
jgi:cbb3-type cytochrome oxidase subunit 3